VELRPADRSRCAGPDPRCLPIEKTDVVDPLTVRITLKHPYAAFLGALSSTTSGLLSPASAVAPGNDYKSYVHIVGTGPYTLAERRKGESLTFARYPAYWGRPTSYESVVVRIVPEAATRESLLLAGQVDLIILPPLADVPALQRNPALKVLLARATGRSSSRSTPGSRCSPTGACGRRSTTRWTRRRS